MAETQKKMSDFDKQWAEEMEAHAWQDMKRVQAEIAHIAPMTPLIEEQMHMATQQMKQAEQLARLSEDQALIAGDHLRFNEQQLQNMESDIKMFETEVKELLLKDGYIKSDESLKDIAFNPSGEISINGMKIKEEHKKKYINIHRKYFNDHRMHTPE